MAKYKKEDLLKMYRKMEDIRNFDNKVNQLVRRGEVPGMTHFSVGEEAANVGAISALEKGDFITSNHRGHGPHRVALVRRGDVVAAHLHADHHLVRLAEDHRPEAGHRQACGR